MIEIKHLYKSFGKKESIMQTTKDKLLMRDSNLELLRFIAALMVVVYHCDFLSFASEDTDVTLFSDWQIYSYALVKTFTCCCVNIFVLISGWYGILFSFKKLASLWFQVFFYLILTYGVALACIPTVIFSFRYTAHLVALDGYWFVAAYLVLMFLSPVLNVFVENVDRKTFRNTLIGFYLLSFYYGWIVQLPFYDSGASPLSFIGIYLLARYLRLYPECYNKLTTKHTLIILGALVALVAGGVTMFILNKQLDKACQLISYASPFTIALSVLFLLTFVKVRVQSKFINILGGSSFAVYLLHANNLMYQYYFFPTVKRIFFTSSGVTFIAYIVGLVLAICLITYPIDSIRKAIWRRFFAPKFQQS